MGDVGVVVDTCPSARWWRVAVPPMFHTREWPRARLSPCCRLAPWWYWEEYLQQPNTTVSLMLLRYHCVIYVMRALILIMAHLSSAFYMITTGTIKLEILDLFTRQWIGFLKTYATVLMWRSINCRRWKSERSPLFLLPHYWLILAMTINKSAIEFSVRPHNSKYWFGDVWMGNKRRRKYWKGSLTFTK